MYSRLGYAPTELRRSNKKLKAFQQALKDEFKTNKVYLEIANILMRQHRLYREACEYILYAQTLRSARNQYSTPKRAMDTLVANALSAGITEKNLTKWGVNVPEHKGNVFYAAPVAPN